MEQERGRSPRRDCHTKGAGVHYVQPFVRVICIQIIIIIKNYNISGICTQMEHVFITNFISLPITKPDGALGQGIK